MSHDEDCPAFVARCWRCGAVLDVIEAATSWNEGVLWGYVAQREHDRSGRCQPTLL